MRDISSILFHHDHDNRADVLENIAENRKKKENVMYQITKEENCTE